MSNEGHLFKYLMVYIQMTILNKNSNGQSSRTSNVAL